MKYIYVLRSGKDHYKVGVANNVVRRVKELQTSNPNKIDIVATKLVDQAEQLEKIVHKFLVDYRLDGGTEWFKLSHEQVVEVLIRVNQIPEAQGLAETISMRSILKKYESSVSDLDKNMKLLVRFLNLNNNATSKPKTVRDIIKSAPVKPVVSIEDLAEQAMQIFIQDDRASTSLLQRRLGIGYSKAARVVDHLVTTGKLGEQTSGSGGRRVLGI